MKSILFGILTLVSSTCFSQNTVGLIQKDSGIFPGYSLFSPVQNPTTYLIDDCGKMVNSWTSQNIAGVTSYFLEDGTLLRAARIPGSFSGGGVGGRLERFDWAGNMIWSYNYATQLYHHHHDFHVKPNGNILVIAWERRTLAEVIQAGRDTAHLPPNNGDIWSERIAELQPIGTDSANVVWQWSVWDHLIQDFDSTKSNYGVVADNPGRININFAATNALGNPKVDWIHFNSVVYHPIKQQILVSSNAFSEFWIIDHSTTTQEAATGSGGLSGKGGDLLYRWGNPESYNRGTPADRNNYAQHNVHWIPDGYKDGGKIMFFNNGNGNPTILASKIEIIDPPVDSLGNYTIDPVQAYLPATPQTVYPSIPTTNFYSQNMGGVSRLPNGNTLICESVKGKFFEVDSLQNIVWEYINPVNTLGPVTQGTNITGNNVFRVNRYAASYPGFNGLTLVPGNPIELNPTPGPCDSITSVESLTLGDLYILENPVRDFIRIENPKMSSVEAILYTLSGQKIASFNSSDSRISIESHYLNKGIYILMLNDVKTSITKQVKIVKM